MKKTAGHIIRISGLVIEMLGIWGVYRTNTKLDQPQIQLPSGTTVPLSWIAVGAGFALWLTGTILVYAGWPRRKTLRQDDRELAP